MSYLGNLMLGGRGLSGVQPGLGRTYWPRVNVALTGCTPPRNYSSAPGRYIQLSGQLQDCLHIAFPKAFFDYQKEELRRLRNNPPQSIANSDAKVFWALDVWARINWCLFSLNIPLGPYNIATYPTGPCKSLQGACSWTEVGVPDNPVLARLKAKQDEFWASASMARAGAMRAIDFELMNGPLRERIKAAPARPAPFMQLVYEWYGTRGRFDVAYPNTLRDIVQEKCIPWMVGGDRLPSKDGKDAGFVDANSNNPQLLRAIRQWRLWSIIDYFPWSTMRNLYKSNDDDDPTNYDVVPRYMGKLDERATLEDYLRRVRNENPNAEIVGTEGGWYPTLQYSIAYGLPKLIDVITSTDYEQTVRDHVASWANASKPPMDRNGNMQTWYAGPRWGTQPKQLPLTCEDFNDATKGRRDAIESRAHASVEDPKAGCADADTEYGKKACESVADMNAYLEESFPVAGWMFDLQRYMAHALIMIGGMAEGVSYVPYRVMHHPFVRNLRDPVFSTVADGSTKTVLSRITMGLFNIETQLGLQLESWTMGPPPPPQRTRCDETRRDSKGVIRCVSTVPADCYEIFFDQNGEAACLSRFTPQEWSGQPAQDPVKLCREALDGYLLEQQTTLPQETRVTAMSMCQRELAGNLPPGTAANFVVEQVKAQKQRMNIPLVVAPPTPKLPWAVLGLAAVGGFILYRRQS